MHIEIFTGDSHGCQMKCVTCPAGIQNMQGSFGHRAEEVYALLKNKYSRHVFQVSFMGKNIPLEKLSRKFNLEEIACLGIFMPFPYNPVVFKETLEIASGIVPEGKLNIGMVNKETIFTHHSIEWLVSMAQLTFESRLMAVQVGFNNNSLPLKKFKAASSSFVTQEIDIHAKILTALQDILVETSTSYESESRKYIVAYDSLLEMRSSEKTFQFARRILSPVHTAEVRDLEYYRTIALRDIQSPGHFHPAHMILTFTPLGVRINHRSHDSENPFLWITYDELEMHIGHAYSIEKLCENLHAFIHMTIKSVVMPTFLGTVDENMLVEIAVEREKIMRVH